MPYKDKEKQKEYMKKYSKKYYIRNKEKKLKYQKQYNDKNPEKIKETSRIWYKNNLEKVKEKNRCWKRDNPEKVKKQHKQWMNLKYKTDLKSNLDSRISGSIRRSLKENRPGRHWENLVGYTLNDLIKRLKNTIPKGYVWQDYINGKLEIDHKIPKSVFNFNSTEDINFKRCWALNNLRLLLAEENQTKRNKLSQSFQPPLKI